MQRAARGEDAIAYHGHPEQRGGERRERETSTLRQQREAEEDDGRATDHRADLHGLGRQPRHQAKLAEVLGERVVAGHGECKSNQRQHGAERDVHGLLDRQVSHCGHHC
ncbi:hypothetical protein D3C72_1631120 [compost metagenome]